MATAEDRAHAQKMLKTLKARLRFQELKKAKLGDSADPVLDMDIQEVREAIAEIEGHKLPAVVIEARQATRNQYDNDLEFIMADGAVRNRRLTQSEERQETLAVEVHEIGKEVLNLKATVADSEKARASGAPFLRRVLVGIAIVASLGLLVGCVALALASRVADTESIMNGNIIGLSISLALAAACLWGAWRLRRKHRL